METAVTDVLQINTRLEKGIKDAQTLLAFASARGKPVNAAIVRCVTETASALGKRILPPEEETKFWDARTQLTVALAPLTIDSVNATTEFLPKTFFYSTCTRARLAELYYRNWAIAALVLLLVVQVFWIIGSSVIAEIQKTEAEFAETLIKRSGTADRGTDGSSLRDSTRTNMDLTARLDTLIFRQDANYLLLNKWIWPLSWAVPPLAEGAQAVSQQRAAMFQISLMALDVLQRYFLSLLYGFLGACVFIIRVLSDEIRACTYQAESDIRFRSRLYLGALGGMVIAWFVAGEGSPGLFPSLSPFALAFVAGYGVELLFTLMDKIITAFSNSPSAPQIQK